MGGRSENSQNTNLRKNKLLFEWDENKSRSNKEKHGIDFEEAINLWNNNKRIHLKDVITMGEVRNIMISRYKGKFYTSVSTLRGKVIRLISVRRSHNKEEKIYEKTKSNR